MVTPRLYWLVEQEAWSHHAKNASGACMYGTDSSKWSAVWFDVVTICELQRIAEHNARVRAEASEAGRR